MSLRAGCHQVLEGEIGEEEGREERRGKRKQ
jgi:hypothetical protein